MKPRPLIAPCPDEVLPQSMREAVARSRKLRGDDTFIRVMGHAPEMYEWYGDFYRRIFHGGRVGAAYKELLRYRLSTLHGCAFCNKGNREDALAAGLSPDQLRHIDDPGADCWSAAQAVVIRLAGEMALTRPSGSLSPTLHAELSEHFDEGQILELGITMAVLTGMAKFLFVFDLVEREDYCEFGPAPPTAP